MADGNAAIMARMLEMQNPAKFTRKFTGNRRDTFPYIFAMKRFLKINMFNDEGIKFQKIFNSIPEHFQNQFMTKYGDNDNNLNVDHLARWMLLQFPPPQTKHEFIISLKTIRYRLNEDPNAVHMRYKTKLATVKTAIDLLNEQVTDDQKEIKKINHEQQMEILTGIFVRNNNNPKFHNVGSTNKRVVDYIARKDPQDLAQWNAAFKSMKKYLIPKVFQGMKEYTYTTYAPAANDDDIYLNKRTNDDKVGQKKSSLKRPSLNKYDNKHKRRYK